MEALKIWKFKQIVERLSNSLYVNKCLCTIIVLRMDHTTEPAYMYVHASNEIMCHLWYTFIIHTPTSKLLLSFLLLLQSTISLARITLYHTLRVFEPATAEVFVVDWLTRRASGTAWLLFFATFCVGAFYIPADLGWIAFCWHNWNQCETQIASLDGLSLSKSIHPRALWYLWHRQ